MIQYYVFRILNSQWFSVMNSYYEFIIMKSNSWIQIEYNEFLYLNSYFYEFIHEFRIYTFVFICMNSYTHEFISSFHIWIHMYMNSYIISYMNSYDYEFIWQWIHMIFSYINSCSMNSCSMNSCVKSVVPRFHMMQDSARSGCPSWQRHRTSGIWYPLDNFKALLVGVYARYIQDIGWPAGYTWYIFWPVGVN